MTAVIGILNKKGAAIAADSAVTRQVMENNKVTKNGNKMVRMSDVVPISVMLTGNGDFLHTQWDIIIRHYRQHRGDVRHGTVEACVHDFFRYIADNHFFCDRIIVDSFVEYQMDCLFCYVTDNVERKLKSRDADGKLTSPKTYLKAILKNLSHKQKEWSKTGVSEQFKDYTQQQFHEYAGSMITDFFEKKSYGEDDLFLYGLFPHEILEAIYKQFELTLMTRLTTRQPKASGNAQLVFTGFGTNQQFPSLVSTIVFEGFDNRVNYHILPEDIVNISDEKPVAICPFAQTDVIESVLGGLHAPYNQLICKARKKMFSPFDTLCDPSEETLPIDYFEFHNQLDEIKVDDLYKRLDNAVVGHLNRNMAKWEKALENYDLLAMAALAKSLIELTAFHRIIHFLPEGVGGPVDLAVITKNEGFTWLSRKSWYHHKDIGGRYGVLGL